MEKENSESSAAQPMLRRSSTICFLVKPALQPSVKRCPLNELLERLPRSHFRAPQPGLRSLICPILRAGQMVPFSQATNPFPGRAVR